MKITLSSEALNALKKIQFRFKNESAKSQKRFAPLANRVLIDAATSFDAEQICRLEASLIPPSKERKKLIDQFEKFLEQHGKDSFLKLERRLNRKIKPNDTTQKANVEEDS